MDKRIIRFLKKHHVCTLATCRDGEPWCASVFYVFIEEESILVFTSDPVTRHITEALLNQKVAGAIAVETQMIGQIRGAQLSGVLLKPSHPQIEKKINKAFLKRFPYAILNSSPLWIIELHQIKFTDNRLGFGTKIQWSRPVQSPPL